MTHDAPWISYSDGASRGNPGLSGAGALILSPAGEETELRKFLGTKTNNQAEYEALLLALDFLIEKKVQNVVFRADSELLIKQLRGEYKVKNENILPLFQEIKAKLTQIKTKKFEHVRREINKEADRLSNEAIDDHAGF